MRTGFFLECGNTRVAKTTPTSTTYYVYDAMGQLAAEYATGTIAASPCTTCYVAADHLGSTRALWDTSGLKARYDYHPFGEAIAADRNGRTGMQCAAGVTTCYNGPSSIAQRFTGQLRDEETGLDYFNARYMASGQGRFRSADRPLLDQYPEDPRSWNLYSYVRNNPMLFVDPTGMTAISAEDCKKNPDCVSVSVNVIYDQNAQIFDQDGNILPEVQSKVDDQIAAAQDTYGDALVSFEISYSTGAIQGPTRNQKLTGTQPGINVVVTDSRDSLVPGGAIEAGGRVIIRLNAGTSDRSTLSHELGHVLAGDTRVPKIPVLGQIINAMLDIRTDAARFLMPFYSPYHGNRFDPPPSQRRRVTNLFNQGARRFRRP